MTTKLNKVYWGNDIQGWMSPMELQFLYLQACKCQSVLEIGSWKGRSTHALCSGCPGTVTAIDHWQGSAQIGDQTNYIAKVEDVYGQFQKNLAGFDNLEVMKMPVEEAKKVLKDKKFDMIFIDSEHTYAGVKADIASWRDNATKILCGHDYCAPWPDVIRAVDESLIKSGVCDSIWFLYGSESSQIDTITRFTNMIKRQESFSFVKRGDGEEACMSGAVGGNCDGSPYSPELAKKLTEAFEYFAEKDGVYVPLFNEQAYYNTFLHRTDNDLAKLRNFYSAIREDRRNKVYVGPKRLATVARLLKAEFVPVPEQNGFAAYDEVLSKIVAKLFKDNIVMLSFGMMAKPMIAHVLKLGDNTCLDLGSAWDPLISTTRTYQISQREILDLYKDWLIDLVVDLI